MLISTAMRSILMYGSLAACLGLLVHLWTRPVGTQGAAKWIPRLLAPLMLAIAAWLYYKATDVVVVTDGPDGPRAERKVSITGVDYPLAPGTKRMDKFFSADASWILNDSSRTVRVVHVSYGMGFGGGSDPDEVPPGTAVQVYSVDHIGPNDRPPQSVQVDSRIPMDSRIWLTWDPVSR